MSSPLPPSNGLPPTSPSKSIDDQVALRGRVLLRRVFPALVLAGELLELRVDRRLVRHRPSAARASRSSICGAPTSGSASRLTLTSASLPGVVAFVELDLRLERRADLLLVSSCWTPSWTAPWSASPRRLSPCILRIRLGGTLPGRKPGMRICGARRFTSCSTRASMSSAGMVSMKARFRPSFSVSTVLMVTFQIPNRSLGGCADFRARPSPRTGCGRNGAGEGTRTPTSCDTGT